MSCPGTRGYLVSGLVAALVRDRSLKVLKVGIRARTPKTRGVGPNAEESEDTSSAAVAAAPRGPRR